MPVTASSGPSASAKAARWWQRLTAPAKDQPSSYGAIEGWDPQAYLALNPDVAAAGEDPLEHFRKHGRAEGRRWR